MRTLLSLVIAAALCACATPATAERDAICSRLPEGDLCAYDKTRDADADLSTAMAIAADNGQMVLLVMGADWCHDSRALAGHLAKPRFDALIAEHYRLVFVDVGRKSRNQHIAQRFGLDGTPGTPTVLVLDSAGQPLNLDTAPSWRNAASRTEDAIFEYFDGFTKGE